MKLPTDDEEYEDDQGHFEPDEPNFQRPQITSQSNQNRNGYEMPEDDEQLDAAVEV